MATSTSASSVRTLDSGIILHHTEIPTDLTYEPPPKRVKRKYVRKTKPVPKPTVVIPEKVIPTVSIEAPLLSDAQMIEQAKKLLPKGYGVVNESQLHIALSVCIAGGVLVGFGIAKFSSK